MNLSLASNMNLSIASNLNNLAIARLQQGKSVEALHLLHSALSDLKNQIDPRKPFDHKKEQQIAVVECHDNRCKQGQQNDDFPCTSNSSGIQESKICLQKTPGLTDMVNVKLLGQSAITLFDHALLVESPGEDEEILIAVVLYNWALVEHIFAADDTRGLSRALFRYKLSFAVIRKSTSPLPPQVCLLIGALYNNMAHIYSLNSCALETGRCMQRLVGLVASEEASAFLDHEDQTLFYLNALVELNANAASAA
jgi:hypothetical protein